MPSFIRLQQMMKNLPQWAGCSLPGKLQKPAFDDAERAHFLVRASAAAVVAHHKP